MSRAVLVALVVLALLYMLSRSSAAPTRAHDSAPTGTHADELGEADPKGEVFIEGGPSNLSDWVSWDGRWPSRAPEPTPPPLVTA